VTPGPTATLHQRLPSHMLKRSHRFYFIEAEFYVYNICYVAAQKSTNALRVVDVNLCWFIVVMVLKWQYYSCDLDDDNFQVFNHKLKCLFVLSQTITESYRITGSVYLCICDL